MRIASRRGLAAFQRLRVELDDGERIVAEVLARDLAHLVGSHLAQLLELQVERVAKTRPAPRDWCYVFNFRDPARPDAISLPPDRGHQLGHDIDELIANLRASVPKAFESDEYAQRRDQVGRELMSQRDRMFEALQSLLLPPGSDSTASR